MTDLKRLCETDLRALAAVAVGDAAALGRIQFSHFILINQLKNNPYNLEFLLKAIDERVIVSYPVFFRDVRDCRTFDLYKQYGVKWHALARASVSAEQWAYMRQIGYVDDGAADSDSDCGRPKPDSSGSETDDGASADSSETIDRRRRVGTDASLAVTVRVSFALPKRRHQGARARR